MLAIAVTPATAGQEKQQGRQQQQGKPTIAVTLETAGTRKVGNTGGRNNTDQIEVQGTSITERASATVGSTAAIEKKIKYQGRKNR
jgi:hypothetical protein